MLRDASCPLWSGISYFSWAKWHLGVVGMALLAKTSTAKRAADIQEGAISSAGKSFLYFVLM